MLHIVGRMPRYECGTGTMVSIAFLFDEDDGGASDGDVHVAICARRSMVSKGKRIERSNTEPRKVKTLQLLGFKVGSRFKCLRRKSGVDVEMAAGSVDVKKVIGMRCSGMI